MAEIVRGASLLEAEIEKTKFHLVETEDNLKKIIGRDFIDYRGRGRRSRGGLVSRGRRLSNQPMLGLAAGRGAPSRHVENLYPEESYEEELPNRPTLMSAVLPNPKDLKSRHDVIEEQKEKFGKVGMERNKRMFGALLGTLKQFKQEEKKVFEEKEAKREKVEHKVEQKVREENDGIRREKGQLFRQRKEDFRKMGRLQSKMYRVKEFDWWATEHAKLGNFIRTKAEPFIFYLPKAHNAISQERLDRTAASIKIMVAKKREILEEEIAEMTNTADNENDEKNDNEETGTTRRSRRIDREGNSSSDESSGDEDKSNKSSNSDSNDENGEPEIQKKEVATHSENESSSTTQQDHHEDSRIVESLNEDDQQAPNANSSDEEDKTVIELRKRKILISESETVEKKLKEEDSIASE